MPAVVTKSSPYETVTSAGGHRLASGVWVQEPSQDTALGRVGDAFLRSWVRRAKERADGTAAASSEDSKPLAVQMATLVQ